MGITDGRSRGVRVFPVHPCRAYPAPKRRIAETARRTAEAAATFARDSALMSQRPTRRQGVDDAIAAGAESQRRFRMRLDPWNSKHWGGCERPPSRRRSDKVDPLPESIHGFRSVTTAPNAPSETRISNARPGRASETERTAFPVARSSAIAYPRVSTAVGLRDASLPPR